MKDRVRWGIIGASNIAERVIRDIRRVPGCEVIAVASRSTARGQEWADRNQVPRVFGSYAELAEADEVDVAYVTTVHSEHFAAASTCLDAGKPVVVEKPFTTGLADAEDLVRRARETGTFLMEAMWMLCNPVVLEVRERVLSGDIGDLLQVRANLGPSPGRNARLFDRTVGGGVLLECGVYPVAFAFAMLGEPQRIDVSGHIDPASGIDDAVGLLLGYADGAHALLTSSVARSVAPGPISGAQLVGTKGWIELSPSLVCPDEYVLYTKPGRSTTVHRPTLGGGYVEQSEEVARCIRDGALESSLIPHSLTLGTMSVIDTALRQTELSYTR
jgi:predicted dehydrogenase